MDLHRRASNLKGVNKDLWRLIYDEIDYTAGSGNLTCKSGTGVLTITKIKSHSDGRHIYCRQAPIWQIGVNDVADKAADIFSDHTGALFELRQQEKLRSNSCGSATDWRL